MPEEDGYELVDGELVPKEAARGTHGQAQGEVFHALTPYRRSSGGPPSRPGGWWFAVETLIQFDARQIRKPDIAGWRRERMVKMPEEVPITLVPDWIGEVLSPTNPSTDTVVKMRLYHRSHVGHHWLIDPPDETVTLDAGGLPPRPRRAARGAGARRAVRGRRASGGRALRRRRGVIVAR